MSRLLSFIATGLLIVTGVAPARGGVTYTGTVTPAVNPGDVLIVGPSNNDNLPGVDPRGSVTVDGGSELVASRALVGDSPVALARALVSGFGSKLSVTDDGNEFASTLGVGQSGSGYLRVEDGAWVEVGATDQQRGVMTIGQPADGNAGAPGVSTVEVSGPASLLTVGRELIVHGGPATSLRIDDGGVVRVGGSNLSNVAVRGRVEVVGLGSELQTDGLVLGLPNGEGPTGQDGELVIRDGAVVRQLFNTSGSAQVGPNGRIALDGGVLAVPLGGRRRPVGLAGTLEGSGVVTREVGVGFGGLVSVGPGDVLELQSDLTTTGDVRVTDGEMSVFGLFTTADAGEIAGDARFVRSDVELLGGMQNRGSIAMTDSTLRLARGVNGAPLQQLGSFSATGSQIQVEGAMQIARDIELTDSEFQIRAFEGISVQGSNFGPARLVLNDSIITSAVCCAAINNNGVVEARSGDNRVDVDVRGGSLVVGPEASIDLTLAEFFGGASFAADATARFSEDSQLSDLDVTLTEANLGRPSIVGESNLPPDFDEAQLFVSGSLTVGIEGLSSVEAAQEYKLIEADRLDASFSEFDLPDLPGTLELLPTLTETSLSLVVIDTTEELPGDLNADGAVDAADYTVWRNGLAAGVTNWVDRQLWLDNYGRVLDTPGPLSVPEPGSAIPALTTALAMICRSSRRFSLAA